MSQFNINVDLEVEPVGSTFTIRGGKKHLRHIIRGLKKLRVNFPLVYAYIEVEPLEKALEALEALDLIKPTPLNENPSKGK